MKNRLRPRLFSLLLALAMSPSAHAADEAGGQDVRAVQRKALEPLAQFDGIWRGPAKVWLRGGKQVEMTQTERVGGFLDGTIRVIEGRGYAADGTLQFNAFAVISYRPRTKTFNFRSYAQGHESDFPLEVTPDGFVWSLKAGPAATIRYTATVKGDVWTEVGERLVDGKPPARMFEMTLRRVGSTEWPREGTVGPKERVPGATR